MTAENLIADLHAIAGSGTGLAVRKQWAADAADLVERIARDAAGAELLRRWWRHEWTTMVERMRKEPHAGADARG